MKTRVGTYLALDDLKRAIDSVFELPHERGQRGLVEGGIAGGRSHERRGRHPMVQGMR